ncbi:bifunctional diguanylate cyclase/phosphodiesterase [Roseovarius sp. ZX-A-9]|uniref:bifunctional diguanylate cyclase/phosphodiesterase n=1 Tax=Roseovarius sp. ZX-A-9 TaxID=3014783 RepID=UPI00232F534F|nr:bifunctional diguanylate cyclase/phosphodiesterase [Roseovarius sp. ZX-A-9]
MNTRLIPFLTGLRRSLRLGLQNPSALALLPAFVLAGFWLGGEEILIMLALGYPICLAFAGVWTDPQSAPYHDDNATIDRDGFQAALDCAAQCADRSSRHTACILLQIDDYSDLPERFGADTAEAMIETLLARLKSVLRAPDRVCRLDDALFAVSIAPVRRLDLGDALHLANRLHGALEEPVLLDGATVYNSASVGLSLDFNLRRKAGPALLEAAETALAEALRHGPSAMRAYSQEMHAPTILSDAGLSDEVSEALDAGQIGPWFQPQISTDMGRVTGFEALARWTHPTRGMIAPAEFLPPLELTNRMERLGEVMLYGALSALKSWDAGGLDVPRISVDFAPEELRNPNLVQKIEWELDRFELAQERLGIEILETVVASSPDDTIVRNISGLSKLGCQIDLDDFGTGHASISSIRRFDVQRLKIDRSFVTRVNRDPEQQRMVSAILLMAERLGLDTLAEGVETAGEHALLAQLGCGHVQGFGIGRPMPLDQIEAWICAHLEKLDAPTRIGTQFG